MSSHSDQSDEQLMAALAHEPEVYGILIARYQDKLARYIMRVSGIRGDELDDVLQGVFVKAYEKSASFNPALSFNAWVYRIAHNETINYWKKNKRYQEGSSFDGEMTAELQEVLADDTTSEELLRAADQELIRDALGNIKAEYRSILILRFFEEQSYEEIGDVLQMPGGTVATKIHRAKKALAKQVEILQGIT